MLGELVKDGQFHCFDVVGSPILPNFGLEPPCLGESHAWTIVTCTDMFSQQWAMSKLQGLEQVFTRGVDLAEVFHRVI